MLIISKRMATSFTPHPLFISHLPSIPTSRLSLAPQLPSPPPQLPLIASSSSELQSWQPLVQQNQVDFSLTRRSGLGAGLAWAGFLALGVVSQGIKIRQLGVSQQEDDTRDAEKAEEVSLPNEIRYYDLRIGKGATPRTGDLVIIDLKGRIMENDAEFVDTYNRNNKRTIALVMGSRPYTRGMCEGIEHVLMTMKAGGKRRVVVPPNLGFGEKGADFCSGIVIPAFATLEYIVEVDKVLVAPF